MRARTKPPGCAQPPCSRYVTPSTSSACHWTRPTLMPSSSSSRSTSTSTSRPTNRVNRSAEIARCTSTISSRRSRLTPSSTSSSYCIARVPSCGEYENAPMRSNCASSRKASNARKSHEARRTDREVGDGAAQPGELLPQGVEPLRAPHPLEHAIGRMLDRHVDVGNDARFTGHQLHQALVDAGGVDVQEAEPRYRGLAEQRLEQIGQLRAPHSEIPAPVTKVLSNKIDLFRAL